MRDSNPRSFACRANDLAANLTARIESGSPFRIFRQLCTIHRDPKLGGPKGARTPDLTDAIGTLSRLSYRPTAGARRVLASSRLRLAEPVFLILERNVGLEPTTSTLARLRSTTELIPHCCVSQQVGLEPTTTRISRGRRPPRYLISQPKLWRFSTHLRESTRMQHNIHLGRMGVNPVLTPVQQRGLP